MQADRQFFGQVRAKNAVQARRVNIEFEREERKGHATIDYTQIPLRIKFANIFTPEG